MIGQPASTVRGWVSRGLAHPDVEPWGSFAQDYLRAERGLEGAAAGAVSMTVMRLFELTKRANAGDLEAALALSKDSNLKELLNVLASRYPADWGQSKHRVPETEVDPQEWLDAYGLQKDQLVAMFDDPPDVIAEALAEAGFIRIARPLVDTADVPV